MQPKGSMNLFKGHSFEQIHSARCVLSRTSMRTIRKFSSSTTTIQNTWRKLFEEHASKNNIGIHNLFELDIKNLDERTSQLVKNEFKGSLYLTACSLFPEVEWLPWKFKSVPTGYWTNPSNDKKFFDDLGKTLGIQTLDDWYHKLSVGVIVQHGGRALLTKHKSPQTALTSVYPEHNWIPWKFKMVPRNFWRDPSNQRKFFDDLGKKVGVENLDDWYEKLSQKVLVRNCGRVLLDLHNRSPTAALMAAYPDHNWIVWKFNTVPSRFWKSKENQRKYFDWLGSQIGVKHLDDWYEKLSQQVLAQNCGQSLLVHEYKGSPKAALMAAYPEHSWIPWKFTNFPKWNEDTVSKYLAELSEKLSIQTLDDWYRVDYKQLGLKRVVAKHNGLYNFFKHQYPHHSWDPKKFLHGSKKTQRWLVITLKKMFPDKEILEDYLHPKVTFPETKRPIQLDVFIPSTNLAFEFQGQQHYEDIHIFSPSKRYQQRDEQKRVLCAANNIKLIEVPYWWNRTPESLQKMLASQLQGT